MKRIAALALAALLAAGLTGCGSLSLSTDVDKLLRAPQQAGETSEVQKALNSYLGESAQLKYPTSGEFLTPFLFGDWNGDGVEDSAVLYTCSAKGPNICLCILERRESGWVVTQEVEGLSTEVESVSFAGMDSSDACQLIVGYGSTQGDRYLAVYSYQNQTLQTVLQKSYSQMLLADITGDGSDDLVLVMPEDENEGVRLALLTNRDGSFEETQQISVGAGAFTGCAGLCVGIGTDDTPYLVLDGRVGTYLASSILIYDNAAKELTAYTPPGVAALSDITVRYNTALLSRDIDGNGTVDIPTEVTAGGMVALELDHRLSFVQWHDYTGGNAGNSYFGVEDEEYEFYLTLPEAWMGMVLLDSIPSGDGWRILDQERQELVSVRLMDLDAAMPNGYARVGTIGNQQIRVRISAEPSEFNLQQFKAGLLIL